MLLLLSMAHFNLLPWFLDWLSMSWCSHSASEMQTQNNDPKVLEITEKLLNFRSMMSSDTAQFLFLSCFFFLFSSMPCHLLAINSLTRYWSWGMALKAPSPNHWTTGECSSPTPTFLTSVLPFHILHLWTVQTGKKHLFSSWQMEGISSFLPTETMFLKFSNITSL